MVSYSNAAWMLWWDELFLKAHTVLGGWGVVLLLLSALFCSHLSLSVFQPIAFMTSTPLPPILAPA